MLITEEEARIKKTEAINNVMIGTIDLSPTILASMGVSLNPNSKGLVSLELLSSFGVNDT